MKLIPADVNYVHARARRRQEILDGKRLPTSKDMREGLPPFEGDAIQSIRAMAAYYQTECQDNQPLVSALQTLEEMDGSGYSSLLAVDQLVPATMPELEYRVKWHLSLIGDESAAEWIIACGEDDANVSSSLIQVHQAAFAKGLKLYFKHTAAFPIDDVAMDIVVADGLQTFGKMSSMRARLDRARRQAEKGGDSDDLEERFGEELRLLAEDRLESAPPQVQQLEGVVVVPDLQLESGKDRSRARKAYERILGETLPFVTRGDVAGHYRSLSSRWPHVAAEIELMLRDLSAQEPVWFRPTILVSGPGTGKSSLARALARQCRLPHVTFNCGGLRDAMFGGLSASYSTASACVPVQMCRDGGVANPLIILDEIEKAGRDRDHGAIVDVLLGLFDRQNARAYRDPGLECNVDVSWVSYILTANDLGSVPAPLLDRCRVIRVPDPTWEHIGTLSKSILEDIAQDRGIDPRWYPPLAPDELEVIKETWSQGSLRRLRRAVEITLDAREMTFGRA